MKLEKIPVGRLVIALLFAAVAGGAWAASLQISPINIFITAPEKAGAVSLANRSETPVSLQVRIVRWRQEGGRQILERTQDVIANPPAMTIPGNQTYTIRLARLVSLPVSSEESYRLLIDELPSPIDQDTPNNGVRMLLRTSLPVFFSTKSAAPKISWHARVVDGRLRLDVANDGNRHIKLVDLSAETTSGRIKFNASGIDCYVLPGTSATFVSQPLASPLPVGTPITITTAKGVPFEVKEAVTVSGT